MINCYISFSYNTDIFKNNTCYSFRNRLPKLSDAIALTESNRSYSIALKDICYPSQIFNVSAKGISIDFLHTELNETLFIIIEEEMLFYC